jgi:HPt (histidine-containing phosphotransfer) domain-containing protein
MSTSSHDIQANHMILSLLEKSKMQNEFVLQNLKGVYAVIGEDGGLFRGNKELANLISSPLNLIRQNNFKKLFNRESWNIFNSHLKKISLGQSKYQSFELLTDGLDAVQQKNYYWEVYQFGKFKNQDLNLFFILGTDVTQLRNMEDQLNELFTNIPLGILIINKKGQIESRYSAYVEWILGTSDIKEKPINSILYEPCREFMNPDELKSVEILFSTLGQEQTYFETEKLKFPKRLRYPSPLQDEPIMLEVSYYPVVKENRIFQILLILEDKSEITKIQNEKKEEKALGLVTAKRIEALKKCSPEILPLAVREINNTYQRLQFLVNGPKFPQDVVQCLHGLKGSARIAGFELLSVLCHEAEDHTLRFGIDGEVSQQTLNQIAGEWEGLLSLYQALFEKASTEKEVIQKENYKRLKREVDELDGLLRNKDNIEVDNLQQRVDILIFQLCAIEWRYLSDLKPLIDELVRKTSESANKKAVIEFKCDDVRTSEKDTSLFYEVFLHLLNNAISHGIEEPALRTVAGKGEVGKIELVLHQDGFNVYGYLRDDGQGLDIEKIKNRILEKSLLTPGEVANKTPLEIFQYIFHSGLSTTTEVDKISGRGVGLSAIKDIIEQWNGHIKVSIDPETKGARFDFHIRLQGQGK